MHNIGFRRYIRGWGSIEAGRVPYIDYVYCEAVSTGNTFMKIDRNLKSLRGSNKKLYDIKCILFTLKLYRGGIKKRAGVYQSRSYASY